MRNNTSQDPDTRPAHCKSPTCRAPSPPNQELGSEGGGGCETRQVYPSILHEVSMSVTQQQTDESFLYDIQSSISNTIASGSSNTAEMPIQKSVRRIPRTSIPPSHQLSHPLTFQPPEHLAATDWGITENVNKIKITPEQDQMILSSCDAVTQETAYQFLISRVKGDIPRRLKQLGVSAEEFFSYTPALLLGDVYSPAAKAETVAMVYYASGSLLHVGNRIEQARLDQLLKEGLTKKSGGSS